MRFVNGLEALLRLAEDFQDKRSSMYVLSNELQEVLVLVKEFRGFELKNWRASLDEVADEISEKAGRWWYHIYSLWTDYLSKRKQDTEVVVRQVLVSLQQFLEHSSLGEFQARMDIILCFCGHADLCVQNASEEEDMELCGHVTKMRNILLNVHEYYAQFLQGVLTHISNSRTPIEKGLREFIKITRHSNDRDVNYYSVQSTANKAHKTIHKFSKQFRLLLQQPVQPILVQKQEDWNVVAQDGLTQCTDTLSNSSEVVGVFDIDCFTLKTSISLDLPYFRKMAKFCNKIFTKSVLPSTISTIGDYSTTIIETILQLQALSVETTDDKEKRMKELKQIQARKRYHLSALFKELKRIGLSHKKGLKHLDAIKQTDYKQVADDKTVSFEGISSDLYIWFTTDPTSHVNSTHQSPVYLKELDKCWSEANDYVLRCFTRRTLLMSISRHQEVNTLMHERMRGFSEHLFILLLEQRAQVNNNVKLCLEVRSQLGKLNSLTRDVLIPSLQTTSTWAEKLIALVTDAKEKHHRLSFFLKSLLSPISSEPEKKQKKDKYQINSNVNIGTSKNQLNMYEDDEDEYMNNKLRSSNLSVSNRNVSFKSAESVLRHNWVSLNQLVQHDALKDHPIVTFSGLKEIFDKLIVILKEYNNALESIRPLISGVNNNNNVDNDNVDNDDDTGESISTSYMHFLKDQSHFLG